MPRRGGRRPDPPQCTHCSEAPCSGVPASSIVSDDASVTSVGLCYDPHRRPCSRSVLVGGCAAVGDAVALARRGPQLWAAVHQCGDKPLASAGEIATCVGAALGLGANCSACFGAAAECRRKHCRGACLGGRWDSPGCTACECASCGAALLHCAEIPAAMLPPGGFMACPNVSATRCAWADPP